MDDWNGLFAPAGTPQSVIAKLSAAVAKAAADPALTAKMARVAHAVIKTGTEYRPFLERSDARWKDPSLQVP